MSNSSECELAVQWLGSLLLRHNSTHLKSSEKSEWFPHPSWPWRLYFNSAQLMSEVHCPQHEDKSCSETVSKASSWVDLSIVFSSLGNTESPDFIRIPMTFLFLKSIWRQSGPLRQRLHRTVLMQWLRGVGELTPNPRTFAASTAQTPASL